MKTYAVQLTAKGMGAIGVIQVAGKNALMIVQKMAASPKVAALPPGKFTRTLLLAADNSTLDDAIIVRVDDERYELHVHGGFAVMTVVLETLRQNEVQILSLDEAQAHGLFGAGIALELPLALTPAVTMTAVRVLLGQSVWGLMHWAKFWQQRIQAQNASELWLLHSSAQWILDRSDSLVHLLEPARVAIVGAPNVGKSTLANALLGRPVSITSSLAGTTRDWVDARAIFTAGASAARVEVPMLLVDTAGVRETSDLLEHESIRRTHQQARAADVVIFLFDATRSSEPQELALLEKYSGRCAVIAINKVDVSDVWPSNLAGCPEIIRLSAKTSYGLDVLMQAVLEQLDLVAVAEKEAFAFTRRQRKILEEIALAENAGVCLPLLMRLYAPNEAPKERVESRVDTGKNSAMSDMTTPVNLHLKKTEALLITWADGHQSSLALRVLRKYCPCAGCQGERDILGRTMMPIVKTTYDGPITATGAELVGNYALRIDWGDGHSAGIYTFSYLRQLDATANQEPPITKPGKDITDTYA